MSTIHEHAIVEIKVTGLFGYIDQVLETNKDSRDKIAQLAILYGENGTGKTTLLRLAFHLLSSRTDRGHKNALAKTPFKFLRIKLRDGTSFEAERENPDRGSFWFRIRRRRKPALSQFFELSRDGLVPNQIDEGLHEAIEECASTIIFLQDDRSIEIEPNLESTNPWRESLSERSVFSRMRGVREGRSTRCNNSHDQLGEALRDSIERFDRWLSIQYGRRTRTGMASSHAIYEHVIRRVVGANEPQRTSNSLQQLVDKLVKLSEESKVFETYNLFSSMHVGQIIESLRNANNSQMNVLSQLIAPYIETIEAQFAQLREVYDVIDTFVNQMNNFFAPKRVTYHIGDGLRVHSPRQQRLDPIRLSSGERHLLLILCTAVLARDDRTLIIIDEPEISLNATWQRNLADCLLAISKNSINQFLVASHSLAFIANYRDHVMRLEQHQLANS